MGEIFSSGEVCEHPTDNPALGCGSQYGPLLIRDAVVLAEGEGAPCPSRCGCQGWLWGGCNLSPSLGLGETSSPLLLPSEVLP